MWWRRTSTSDRCGIFISLLYVIGVVLVWVWVWCYLWVGPYVCQSTGPDKTGLRGPSCRSNPSHQDPSPPTNINPPNPPYLTQGENIITWTEPGQHGKEPYDMALSFQDEQGCREIWCASACI